MKALVIVILLVIVLSSAGVMKVCNDYVKNDANDDLL